MMSKGRKARLCLLLAGALSMGLAACSRDTRTVRRPSPMTLPEGAHGPLDRPGAIPGGVPRPEFEGPPVLAVAQGSRFKGVFAPSDEGQLANAMWQALVSPDPEETVDWTNPATGAAGSVKVRQAYLINVENVTGGRMWAPTGIDTSHVLDPASGEYAVARPAVNVRLAPSTEGWLAKKLTKGTVVTALGREPVSDWLLVARRGVVQGYVYAPLLEARGDEGLTLAGGASRRPVLCRDFRQSATLGGRADEWDGAACRAGDGRWQVVEDVLNFSG